MQRDELQPQYHLNALSKRYPNAWKMAENFRARRGKDLPAWPEWCFIPTDSWDAIVSAAYSKPYSANDYRSITLDADRLAAIGAWRYTQGIYRFDQDLLAALVDTELTGDLPSEVLLRFPEWSIYVETPELIIEGRLLHGVWLHLDWDPFTGNTILQFLQNSEKGLFQRALYVGPWSIQEATARAANDESQLFKQAGIRANIRNATEEYELAKQQMQLLSLLLYICSDEPDMSSPHGTTPSRPELKKTKKGLRLFAPDKPTIWCVGESIGRKLRQGKDDFSTSGYSRRAHIRRAHWHGYWMGSREEKRFKYNWLSPIVVRGKINDLSPEQAKL